MQRRNLNGLWLSAFLTENPQRVDEKRHIIDRECIWTEFGSEYRVDGVVGYRICLTHRRSSVRAWVDSLFASFSFLSKVMEPWSHITMTYYLSTR
jgi:hypothetical protein